MKKYVSYSEYRTWLYDRDEYVERYIKGVPMKPNKYMIHGTIVHKALETPTINWVKEMRDHDFTTKDISMTRKCLNKMAKKLPVESEIFMGATFDGFKIMGIFDGFNKKESELDEFKTCRDDGKWSQWRVDHDAQLTFYAWIYYAATHKLFHEIRLHRINVAKGTVKTFTTNRSINDIEKIQTAVNGFVETLKRIGIWERRLSRQERTQLSLLTKNQ